MGMALREMFRVLRGGGAAVVVVGTSVMRGVDVETPLCLGEIASAEGFEVVGTALRPLDRDKRMMPARFVGRTDSVIEQRLHEECVLGLLKT
jgi:hypothetical protein